jgi:hypothetical protein
VLCAVVFFLFLACAGSCVRVSEDCFELLNGLTGGTDDSARNAARQARRDARFAQRQVEIQLKAQKKQESFRLLKARNDAELAKINNRSDDCGAPPVYTSTPAVIASAVILFTIIRTFPLLLALRKPLLPLLEIFGTTENSTYVPIFCFFELLYAHFCVYSQSSFYK